MRIDLTYLNVQTERPPVQGLGGSAALVCGCILLSLGLIDQGKVSEADPASDFTNVGTCKVLEVQHSREERQEKQGQEKGTVCFDIYQYRFEYNSASYWSREESLRSGSTCDVSAQIPGSFSVQQDVPCWRTTSQVSESYRCVYEGEVCMKIFDPAQEIREAKAAAEALTIAGAVILPAGIMLLVAAVVACWFGACQKTQTSCDRE